MKILISILSSILLFINIIYAQKKEFLTVPAGSRVKDYIPFQERYRFPEFMDGKVFFRNGSFADTKLNYNFLLSNMEYVQAADTLAIANPTDILLITFASSTFCYDKGYLEIIQDGSVKVAVRQSLSLKETQKRDSYGASSSNSATDSYKALQTAGNTYTLIVNQDRVFESTTEFFIAGTSGGFVPFNKKKTQQ
ncbi:MAG: hypothetical protein ACOYN4_13745, partial [Bacteroidales bacterium]